MRNSKLRPQHDSMMTMTSRPMRRIGVLGFSYVILWLTLVIESLAVPATSTPGRNFPLDGITTWEEFEARIMRGGCWLAGLPGFPRYNGTHIHAGLDLRANLGDTIYAISPGVVDPASDLPHRGYGPGWNEGYAIIIRAEGPGGRIYTVVYGHTQDHLVKGGDRVIAGQALAQIGPWLAEQGGPHLHLTVRLGELPRQGWGTPTYGDIPSRQGAEAALTALDVLRLGYRDPRCLLRGEIIRELSIGLDCNGLEKLAFVNRYRSAYKIEEYPTMLGGYRDAPNEIGFPAEEAVSGGAWVTRWGDGQVQTFVRSNGEAGALLLRDNTDTAVWVHGPIWKAYVLRGGPERFGYPLAEATTTDHLWVQAFQKAVIVWHAETGVLLIPR